MMRTIWRRDGRLVQVAIGWVVGSVLGDLVRRLMWGS